LKSCAPTPTAPNTNNQNTNSTSTTNTTSSVTNGNVVTNVNQVVTSSNIANYYYKYSWGGLGTGDGQLSSPRSIRFSSSAELFVSDGGNKRIQVFSTNGTFLRKWGSSGAGNGQFGPMGGLNISSDMKVYVSDANRVQVFSTNGVYLLQWGTTGTGNGQFDSTYGSGSIVNQNSNSVIVADYGNARIQKFDTNGIYMGQYPISARFLSSYDTNFLSIESVGTIKAYNFSGALLTTLLTSSSAYQEPFVDGYGRVFVPDNGNSIHVISSGALLFQFGVYGTNDFQIQNISSIAFDPLTNVYLCDMGYARIKVFSWGTSNFYYTNYVTNVTTNN
jgi:hypothetical protein